ncbi:MAG: hypothetical protein A2825_00965 [Candidatus Taylorbacteria bacterium RIFCSPHIGHO2_01_FULL_43_120]|nr:MAG: hypothetical protein A2825_00965 [Candidatus Taylorbacteria bacterium RIFCSPHIGHO2_01_FULL_43_120]OHA23568.1 MAG: hypothetical protein A3B98_00410 [Candidatus Taylorbacteria bacterium RIFCSPHIGHO2_02_FULL_43_55]OHA28897.1 MAG: hypothetical protein A3E92_04465 [Candidatus Taylorbacteria bacterium RIFCSPHIGHO2_12_FULL_42_34]OHA30273.1 MAG: hypothetical protein A3B09_03880 [Candidatus Taylorbacteria bacterium RIFCSPLOWO2_01_FULL_43_83]OHA39325.1 MAG: hypothetical protein A3H58_04045 [Candi
MTKKEIISAVKISILSLALVLGVSSIYAWTGPASAPPGGNVAAPLNAGNDAQPKGGGLLLNSAGGAYGLIVYRGLVGIGTATPQSILHINSGGDPRISITGGTAGSTANDGFALIKASNNNAFLWNYELRNIIFGIGPNPAADEKMRITTTGVGIGTAAPETKLEVVGGPIKATGGLIIETRNDDPDSPETGRMWLRTDI